MAQIKSPVKIMKLNNEHNFSFEVTFLAISLDLRSSTNEYIVVVYNVFYTQGLRNWKSLLYFTNLIGVGAIFLLLSVNVVIVGQFCIGSEASCPCPNIPNVYLLLSLVK